MLRPLSDDRNKSYGAIANTTYVVLTCLVLSLSTFVFDFDKWLEKTYRAVALHNLVYTCHLDMYHQSSNVTAYLHRRKC